MENLNYDEFVLEDLKKVYGEYINDFLLSLKKPNSRLYVRVNMIKTSPEDLIQKLPFLKRDEDFPEALYVNVEGPNKIEVRDTLVIVDKVTAESVLQGSYVYKPGIKKILGKNKEVTIISENGIPVAEGEIINNNYIKITKALYSAPPLAETKEYSEGLFYIQNKAAMYVARLLDPQPNETIIDMTAAPGGKLTHVYQLQPKARLIGFDHSETKVEKLKRLLKKMGMEKIQVYKADSRYIFEDFTIFNVDKVLIDPPCSALGIRPKLYDKKTKNDIINFHNYQKQFINSAYKILKHKGILIYSTCTVTTWENEKIVEDNRFEIEEVIRFHPNIHDMTGFFIAKLVKK
jgi:16S rRNA (cytosine967-C5)-methyltransferase